MMTSSQLDKDQVTRGAETSLRRPLVCPAGSGTARCGAELGEAPAAPVLTACPRPVRPSVLPEGRVEMFNLNCQLINFIRHLKQRGGVDITGR